MEVYAIPNQEAVTVADKLIDEFFCRFSIPLQLHSDQGRQFEAEVMREVCRLLQIKKTRTTPYHPQSDGIQDQRGSRSRRRRRLVVHFDRLKPCPKGIRSDDVDSNDINRQEPEPNATQEHSRGPRRPGTTLQLFDVDDEDELEEPAVQRNTEQQPIEAPTQVEQPALPTVAAEEPPPRRYPARIRRPPDRL